MSKNGSFNWLELDDSGKTAGEVKAMQEEEARRKAAQVAAPAQALAPIIEASPVVEAPVPAPVVVSAPSAVVPTLATAAQSADVIRNVMGVPAPVLTPAVQVPVPVVPVTAEINTPNVTGDQLIAVSAESELTGAVVYWELGGECRLADLQAAWAAQDLDPKLLPSVATPEVALSRAVKELTARNVLVRKHPAGGWAIVREATKVRESEATETVAATSSKTLDYAVKCRVYATSDEEIRVEAEVGSEENVEETRKKVQAEYNRNRTLLTNIDMSAWLVKFAAKQAAVPLRERGGVYFVPRGTLPTVRKAKIAIGATNGNTVYVIPAIHSADVIESIFHAVQRDAKTEIDLAEAELAVGIGPRAAANRIQELETIIKKVNGYERLIGKTFDGAIGQLRDLQKRLAVATTRGALIEVDRIDR